MGFAKRAAILLVFLTLLIPAVSAARLPTVGSDTDTWGTLLNAYLSVEHGLNGTHANITATNINVSGNIIVLGNVNTTSLVLGNNCADGQILKWSGGVGVCGTDVGAGSEDLTKANVTNVTSLHTLAYTINSNLLSNATRIESIALLLASNSTYQNTIASSLLANSSRLDALYLRQSADNTSLTNIISGKYNITNVDSLLSAKSNQTDYASTASALAANSTRSDTIAANLAANSTRSDTTALNLSALNTLVYTKGAGSDASKANQTDLAGNSTRLDSTTAALAANSTRSDSIASNLVANSTRLDTLYLQQSADNTTQALYMGTLNTTIIANNATAFALITLNNNTLYNIITNKYNISNVDTLLSAKANQTDLAANSTRSDTIASNLAANSTRSDTIAANLASNSTRSDTIASNLLSNATRLEDRATNLSQIHTLVYSKGVDGGGNATASGTANFISYFSNSTHLIQSLMYIAGETLSINYTNVNVTSTLFINGVNVSSDLSDLRTRLSANSTRLDGTVTALAANSTYQDTIAGWVSLNSSRLDALYLRQSGDNTSLTNILSGKDNITNVDSKISAKANQTDLAANSTRLDSTTAALAANSTYQNTIASWLAANSTRLDLAHTWLLANSTRLDLAHTWLLANATRLEDRATNLTNLHTLVYTKAGVDGGGNATAGGGTGYLAKFVNDTHLGSSVIFTDNSTIGIGTASALDAKLTVRSVNLASNLSLNVNDTLYVNGSTSRVGIGTANPLQTLHIYGRLGLQRIDGGSGAQIYVTTGDALQIRNSADSADIPLSTSKITSQTQNTLVGIDLGATSIGLRTISATTPALFVDDTGNVGINTSGTAAPLARLEIRGTSISNNISLNVNNTLYVNGSSNRVGIGNANPSQVLDVNGNVNASAYITNGTDYAEMMSKLNTNEVIEAGDVVEVVGGKITKSTGTRRTGIYFVITDSAGVLGNSKQNGLPVAFIGQVKVKVNGKVSAGDYILPSKDGTAVAVPRSQMTLDKLFDALGKAIESSEGGTGKVLVAVGVK